MKLHVKINGAEAVVNQEKKTVIVESENPLSTREREDINQKMSKEFGEVDFFRTPEKTRNCY